MTKPVKNAQETTQKTPSEPVNKIKLRDILADFMENIEEWESEIEGSPRKEDFASLDAIYDETIDQLDKENIADEE